MAQSISYGSITISDLTDISDVYLQYALAESGANVDNKYPFNKTGERGWLVTYPDWQSGYQIWIRQVTEKEGLPNEYGTPYLDTAVNQINNRISVEEATREALASRLKKIWINEETHGDYVAGTYAASGIENITFNETNPQTYGYNTLLRHNKLALRYNTIDMTTLTTGALTFYHPAVDSLDHYVQGKKGLELNADSLIFYKPLNYDSQESEVPAATLNSTGLNIVEGTIRLGENFRVNSEGSLTATDGTIGGWVIDNNSLHTNNKISWNDNQKGIYIGTYLDKAGNNSYVIAGGPNIESKGRDGGLETVPYWYIRDDGSARFGDMTLTSDGLLSVPAASVSGTLTSSQINVNDLAAISANIGATIGQGSLTNTLGVSIEKDYVLSTDTRINPLKTYYTKDLDTDIFSEVTYNSTDNDDPSSEYKVTDDKTLEPGGAVRFRRVNNLETIFESKEFTGLEISTFFRNLLNGVPLSVTPTIDTDYESITRITCEIYIYNNSLDKSIYEDNFIAEEYTFSLASSSIQVNLNNEDVNLTALLNNNIENVEASSGFSVNLSKVKELNNILTAILENSEETDSCTLDFDLNYDYETFPRYKQYYQRQVGSVLYEPINYVTNVGLNPYENDYYEIEPWYEKVDSTYITLESHKNVYLLTNDETAKPGTKYYEYSIEYDLTKDAEKKEKKDYYILNNRNIYSLTNDTEVITEIINDEEVVKNYFTIKSTTDAIFIEGKDYLIKDESSNIYRVVEVSQKNQSPVSLGYYEANKIEGLKEHDPIGQNYYESNYYSWYSKIENTDITNPFAAKLFEQNANYKEIETIPEGVNPKELNWYIIRDQYNVQLKLQNAQMNISSNNTNLLTVQSEKENDINITNMEVTGRLKIGNIELIPFNNGLAIRAGGH